MASFVRAIKSDAKLRLAVAGPAGSGKTFTLLRLATALGGKIAAVDTEHGSMSKYAHTAACGPTCADPSHFVFDVIEPSSFDPRNLMDYIREAVAGEYTSFICDSLSHYWMGKDGELDMVDSAAKRSDSRNSFTAWKTVTPIHTALVDLILSAPIHMLVAMRTKTEWVLEKDDKGKTVPRKIGLAPIMRDGIEFEFDVCGDLDQENTLSISKSRCSALQGKAINRPGPEMAKTLQVWLGSTGYTHAPIVEQAPAPKPPATATTESLATVPWHTRGEMKRAFADLKTQIGEARYAAQLALAGVLTPEGFRTGAAAKECYFRMIELTARQQEVA
jgi:hypothetical protein